MGRLRAWLLRLTPYRIAIIVGLAMTAVHVKRNGQVEELPVIGRLENIFHDLKFRERGVRATSGDVVVAAVDEKAIDTIGRWPFARSDIALIVDKLTLLGARAIVFDVAYTDAAFEGRFAGARKLRSRFQDVALTSPVALELLSKLELARTDAAGALAAAQALPDQSDAARDVRTRLAPVAQTLELAAKTLEAYRAMHAEYDVALAQEIEAKSPDAALAASVHQSGRVVLGSFLLTQGETRQVTPQTMAGAQAAIRHVALPFPTVIPNLEGDEELLAEPPPIHGVKFHNFPAAKSPMEILLADPGATQRTAVAFFNTQPDDDGVIRREPLVMTIGDPEYAPDDLLLVPNLDLGGVLKYFDASNGAVRLWTTSETSSQLEYVALLPGSALGRTGAPVMKEFRRIPVDEAGRLLLNYYGPDGTFPNISVADIWSGQVEKERIAGKIVLLGATAIGTWDQRVTPFARISPGVEIHATAMENILHEEYLRRPWWAMVLELAILLGMALVVGRLLARVSVIAGVPVLLAAMVAYHLLDYLLFRSGIAVFSALPLIEIGSIYVLQTIFRYSTEEREKRQVRRAFQFYLTKSVMEEMLKDPSKLKLGGDKRVLSVMFSDIRGFTTIAERLTPEHLAKLINEYLTPMTNLVFEHGGTLDKYIGDAVMAIYGAPVHQDDHALRCCRTAVAMMRELAKLQEGWRLDGRDYPPIDIGIGVNSGPMVVGNMGADQRFDYTVLGDNVNLASRLEGTNKDYRSHIIISHSTYQMCREQVAVRELGAVRVKGKREPVLIYELMDDKPATGELLEVITRFNAGIAAFRSQRWDEARAKFRSVLALWPSDGPPQAYLEFCDEYASHPPGEGWDGVYTMTHK